jgi:hypothetical protein
MPLPTAKKITTEEERDLVIKSALADNDNMIFPTHMVEKNGEVVGGWSLGAIPLVMVWHKSDAIGAKESLILNNTFKSIMNDRAPGSYFIACNDKSPYINHMEKFGYNPVWKTNLFVS